MEYNSTFRLILHTKLANPHYKPEMQAQSTLINFTVTRDGLGMRLQWKILATRPVYYIYYFLFAEDQLLAEVVKAERPDLEELKVNSHHNSLECIYAYLGFVTCSMFSYACCHNVCWLVSNPTVALY